MSRCSSNLENEVLDQTLLLRMNHVKTGEGSPKTIWKSFVSPFSITRVLCLQIVITLCHITEVTSLLGLRLSGGTTAWDGRLEIEYSPTNWGTLCNKLWSWEGSAVACRQLSMGPPLEQLFPIPPEFNLPIVYDAVSCNGDEANLFDCESSALNVHNCHHSEDVTLRCTPSSNYQDFDVVTVEYSASQTNTGRLVLIYFGNSWHTVCNTMWREAESKVLCRQSGQIYVQHGYSQDIPQIFLHNQCLSQNFSCSGSENHLSECNQLSRTDQSGMRSFFHLECGDLLSFNSTQTPPSDQRNVASGLIVFLVIGGCLVIAIIMCKLSRKINFNASNSRSSSGPQPQIQVISVRSLEPDPEDFIIGDSPRDVQVLPDDLPPTYLQFVANPEMFESPAAQNDEADSHADDQVESPPPDYATVTFNLTSNDSGSNSEPRDDSSEMSFDTRL